MDGIYVGYFTAVAGSGIAMFVFKDGLINGADPSGVLFDGSYQKEGENKYTGVVGVTVPPGVTIIQGVTAGSDGYKYSVPISYSENFHNEPYLRLDTPAGSVNVKMKLLRNI